MQRLRPSNARGHVRAGWLDSRHSFSFGQYHDPEWMGWGPLRVINEDRVAPGGGFAPHRHANMEILSYVVDGALAHRDSTGSDGVIAINELQWMSAGHGIEHSEFNASAVGPVHFLQIWIQPDRLNAPPAHAQLALDRDARRARWAMLASPDGVDGSLAIRQQAWLRGALLGRGDEVAVALDSARRTWVQVVSGTVIAGDHRLVAGDAVGVVEESGTLVVAGDGDDVADVLWFDLPA